MGVATSANAADIKAEKNLQNESAIGIDVMDLYSNPENYPNITLVIYDDIDEYINVIEKDMNLSKADKEMLVNNALILPMNSSRSYQYGTITQTVIVNSLYQVYPYFYTKFEYTSGSQTPDRMVSVEAANINRNYNGMSKQFSGSLYYNLEAGNSLYWDLNGDFYHYGETTYTGGGTANLGGFGTASFSASITSSHYQYKQQSGRYYSAAMQP